MGEGEREKRKRMKEKRKRNCSSFVILCASLCDNDHQSPALKPAPGPGSWSKGCVGSAELQRDQHRREKKEKGE